jgi:hypothetical protein
LRKSDVLKRRFDVVDDKEEVAQTQNPSGAPRDINKRVFDASPNAAQTPSSASPETNSSSGNGDSAIADSIANHMLGDQPAASFKTSSSYELSDHQNIQPRGATTGREDVHSRAGCP